MDWRDPKAAGCNAGRNPIQESFYDGVNADPLEVMFVKVKASMRDARWPHVMQVRVTGFTGGFRRTHQAAATVEMSFEHS